MKQKFLVAALLATMAGSAYGFAENVFVYNGDGMTPLMSGNPEVGAFDFAPATAVSKSKGPYGSDPEALPNPFHFLLQTQLNAFQRPNGTTIANGNLNNTNGLGGFLAGGYEFTMVADIFETATNTSATTTEFSPNSGTISIYYDTATASNPGTGTGFVDGVEVIRMRVIGGTSSFTDFTGSCTQGNPQCGNGSTTYEFMVQAVTEFVNPNYIQGQIAPVNQLVFESTQNFPNTLGLPTKFFAGSGNPLYPEYVPVGCTAGSADGTCDLALNTDSKVTFAVPEPGMLLLTGLGLSALGLARRRREEGRNA